MVVVVVNVPVTTVGARALVTWTAYFSGPTSAATLEDMIVVISIVDFACKLSLTVVAEALASAPSVIT